MIVNIVIQQSFFLEKQQLNITGYGLHSTSYSWQLLRSTVTLTQVTGYTLPPTVDNCCCISHNCMLTTVCSLLRSTTLQAHISFFEKQQQTSRVTGYTLPLQLTTVRSTVTCSERGNPVVFRIEIFRMYRHSGYEMTRLKIVFNNLCYRLTLQWVYCYSYRRASSGLAVLCGHTPQGSRQ